MKKYYDLKKALKMSDKEFYFLVGERGAGRKSFEELKRRRKAERLTRVGIGIFSD